VEGPASVERNELRWFIESFLKLQGQVAGLPHSNMADTTTEILADIAILDDDLDFRNYLEDFLKDEGAYTVRAFARPVDLFHGCEEQVPDIVLLDMKMGDATGDKVLEQLLSRWPHLCAIVVTGYPSLEDMRVTFKLKVFDYLAKPFSLTQLRQVLRNAIAAFGLGRTPQDRLRERLGHSIKLLRVARDWSLKDLAVQTKLSVSQISAIERGANLPSIESFLAIAKAFDKKPSEILASIDF
jgi:FixJ family two-component response regulator